MPTPPPLPEYRVSHQGAIQGPFPLRFLEALVLAGQFPRDVQVMPSTGGQWTPLSTELGESSTPPSSQQPRLPDSKTVLKWMLSLAVLAGVVAFIGDIIVADSVRKRLAKSNASAAALAAATPTPRSTPAMSTSSPPRQTGTSLSVLANAPITLPASTPEIRRAIVVSTPSSPITTEESSSLHTGADGKTFRVSAVANRRLQQMQTNHNAEEALIEQQKTSLDELQQDIERSRQSVNRSSQAAINRFNARISNYNNQVENLDMAIDRFNRKIDEYNAELRRVGTPTRY